MKPSEINANIHSMLSELKAVKTSAQYLLNRLQSVSFEDVMNNESGDMSHEDSKALSFPEEGAEQGSGSAPEEGAPADQEGKETTAKPPKIETPEEAKKTLNEAVTDLKGVIQGIDTITGQGEEVAEKTSSQTFRLSNVARQEIGTLTQQAIDIVDDGKSAVQHWAFLLKKKPTVSSSTKNMSLAETVSTVKHAKQAWHELGQVFSTAIPPTGAEFSGDKTLGKRPEKVEIDHFHAGNEEYHKNKAKEDKLPNAASEPRLTDESNPHEFSAYVNAKVVPQSTKESSALVVRALNKEGRGKYAVVSFQGLSSAVGEKNDENYKKFVSPAFAKTVEDHVKLYGIASVASYLNAEVDTIGLSTTAREPKVKDKAKLRAYYADAFGDKEFAKELTSAQKSGSELGLGINSDKASVIKSNEGGTDGMNTVYKPEQDSANDMEGGLEGGNKADSLGSGSPKTTASVEVRKAKARAAVDFARIASSRGLIPFTKNAIAAKAQEVITYSDEKFSAQKELLESMPIVQEAAIKEARIPENADTESGIIASTTESVTKPSNTVTTEGLNTEVKSDAKISQASVKSASDKTAQIVPQLMSNSSLQKESFISKLNTFGNRLRNNGIDPNSTLRRTRAHYRNKD